MNTVRTNLLPPSRLQALSRDYVLRLGVIGLLLMTVLVFVAGLLLVPMYVFLTVNLGAKEASLARVDSAKMSSGESAIADRLTELSKNMGLIAAHKTTPPAIGSIGAVLSIAHPSVTISGIGYERGASTKQIKMTVSGTAATRDALRNYLRTLQTASFIRSADLPVSAYAKNMDIPFVITIALTP